MASVLTSPVPGDQLLKFTLVTHQMYVDGDKKQMDPEVHSIRMRRPGTIAKYIKEGKNVVLSGRLKYTGNTCYVLAENIHYPGSDNAQ